MAELYVLEFPNGKLYVGISKISGDWRLRGHVTASRHPRPRHVVDQAIKKHGVPRMLVLFRGTLEKMAAMEWDLIDYMGTLAPDGYNVSRGGLSPMNGRTHTPETRQKLAASGRRRGSPMQGRRHSEVSRQKMSESKKALVLRKKSPDCANNERDDGAAHGSADPLGSFLTLF